jgi:hypothetical protein
MKGTPDMQQKNLLVALRKRNFGFIGDYYILSSKKSAFYYAALTEVTAYALTKEFLFKRLFKIFPGLHYALLSMSFSRYNSEFRKPCTEKKKRITRKLNSKKKYSQINLEAHAHH